MTKKLSIGAFFDIKKVEHRLSTMHRDVQLLRDNAAYTTCITVVLCSLDALAAGKGRASSGKFEAFVKLHFPALCAELGAATSGRRSGAKVLYDEDRNGLAHLFGPESGFAIAEEMELPGRNAGEMEVDGKGRFAAINADRFINDFLRLVKQLQRHAT